MIMNKNKEAEPEAVLNSPFNLEQIRRLVLRACFVLKSCTHQKLPSMEKVINHISQQFAQIYTYVI